MRALLIDDEPLAREIVRNYCHRLSEITIVGECENGFDAVKLIEETKPDLIFLDVQMPKLNGFEVLELITHVPKVIFTTAFDTYAIKAFEANAQDYLLKPFLFERFELAVQKIKQLSFSQNLAPLHASTSHGHPDTNARIVIKDGEKINIIPLQEVIYLEAYDDYVKIYTSTGRFIKKQTMAYYEKTLPPHLFVRIHRSNMVAIDRIQRIESMDAGRHQVLLTNDVRLPISRASFPELKLRLGW